ncbi:MAG: hypothetical protein HY724_00800 [Candidatus Rokubacteria bacterium]|nr:hypothetical protein [Candidatus Rokubacteria bacterium]
MEARIYTGPHGVTATLTTESSASHYGIPALRIEGPGVEDWPDFGPADVLGSGLTAAAIVRACAVGKLPDGIGGRIHKMDETAREAAQRFLAQWPDGPQIPAEEDALDNALADTMVEDLRRQGR